MPLHIETELAGYREKAKRIRANIERRKSFMEDFDAKAEEARKLHSESIVNEEREYAELLALIDKQEKALQTEKEASATDTLPLEENPATGLQTSANTL